MLCVQIEDISIMQRLSSDYLYHFTGSYNTLPKILTTGFRHSLSEEKLSFANSMQQNFIISFCDIKYRNSKSHQDCYGEYAIALTKEWGRKNGVTPVTYVHENSAKFSQKSIRLKNKNRFIFNDFDINKSKTLYKIFKRYIKYSLLEKKLGVKINNPHEEIKKDPKARQLYNDIDSELSSYLSKLENHGLEKEFLQYVHVLGENILELIGHLENTDWLSRSYEDLFECPISGKEFKKVLYDEREWRSVQDASWLNIDYGSEKYEEAIKLGYLPEKYNLKFNDDDIVQIILNDDKEVNDLIKLSKEFPFLISSKKLEYITITKSKLLKQDT